MRTFFVIKQKELKYIWNIPTNLIYRLHFGSKLVSAVGRDYMIVMENYKERAQFL